MDFLRTFKFYHIDFLRTFPFHHIAFLRTFPLPLPQPARLLGIIKGVGVKGYGVILIWDLKMAKFQTAITRHHWP